MSDLQKSIGPTLLGLLRLVFSGDGVNAAASIRTFLEAGRGWDLVEPELPVGPQTLRELLEAVSASLIRFGLVTDELFDRLVGYAPATRDEIEAVRESLLHPEHLPPAWSAVGPTGGAIEALAADPTNVRRLLCSDYLRFIGPEPSRSGLFRSIDRGATWNELGRVGARDTPARWITFDPHHPGQVWLGAADGLWRSHDNGDSWTRDPETEPDVPIWQVKCHPLVEDARVVATGREIAGGVSASVFTAAAGKSHASDANAAQRADGRVSGWFQFFQPDLGRWVSVKLEEPQTAAAFAPRDWRRVWVAAGRRLVRSDDAFWSFEMMGSPGRKVIRDIACDPEDSDLLLVGTDDGLYRSVDGGETFEARWSGGIVRHLLADGPEWIAATADGPMRSRDRGKTWESLGTGFPEQRCWSVARASDGTVYAGADGTGVFRLDRGSDVWLPRSAGLMRLPSGRPARPAAKVWAAVFAPAVHITRDGGETWRVAGMGGQAVAASDPELRQMAVGTLNGTVRLTRDGGRTWYATQPEKASIYWLHTGHGGVWARTESGSLRRLGSDLTWTDDDPPDPPDPAEGLAGTGRVRPRGVADVVVQADGTWVAIGWDGRLWKRASASGAWDRQQSDLASTGAAMGTWRLASTSVGWFAWKYEGGLYHCPELGFPWESMRLPDGHGAISGLCGDPRGVPAVWAAALDGSLFSTMSIGSEAAWRFQAAAWPTGGCAFLDALQHTPRLLGSGPGGVYSFPVRGHALGWPDPALAGPLSQ